MLETSFESQIWRPISGPATERAVGPSSDHASAQTQMTEDELHLWKNRNSGLKHLILMYLPLVDVWAKRIARSTGCDWQDLRQDGAIGLIKAVERFDHTQGVPFRVFARNYIRGAIFDGSELTRNSRRQEETYRKIRSVEDDLTRTLGRNPTIEEVATGAQITTDQVLNAIDAHGIAFAGAFPNAEGQEAASLVEMPHPERALSLLEALAHLNSREQEIIRLYYWEDQPHEEIAQELGLTPSNVTKIRQRTVNKLRELLDVKRKGGSHAYRRSGK